MPGRNLNFGGSVLKREGRPIDKVESTLMRDGWDKTGQAASGRFRYFEKSEINITAIKGPMGTLIVPSGPIRGRMFGNVNLFSEVSVIGAGANNSNSGEPKARPERTAQSETDTLL